MAQIQFKQTNKYGNIRVSQGDNWYSKLFVRYTHTIPSIKSGDIDLCKEDSCRTKCTFKRDIYEGYPLDYVIVYCNKYSLNFPLLLVLGFKHSNATKRKYFKLFDFETVKGGKNLSSLGDYLGEEASLETLIIENDRIDDFFTFKIDNKNTSNSGLYNNDKIKVTDESEGVQNFKSLGFKKYKHTPQRDSKGKKGCVIYNKDLLIGEGGIPIDDIQDKPYDHINVYYSDKVFEPLLIELSSDKSKSNSNKFYYHTRGNSGSLFWFEINKGSRPFDVEFNEVDIHQELKSKSNSKLLKLLSSISSHLQKRFFVMLDQKTDYSLINVSHAFQLSSVDSSKYRLLNKRPAIKVVDKTNDISKCKGNHVYNVYEHVFGDTVSGIKNGEEKVEIKFLRSIPQNNFPIINLDKQFEKNYYTGSSEVEVSFFFNFDHNYAWVRHYSNNDITNKDFELTFKGQSVKVKADVSDFSHNKSMFVYFQNDNRDRFILLAFPNKENNKIKYLTYDDFKRNYINKISIDMNKLHEKPASINFKSYEFGHGYRLDEELISLLNQEKNKPHSIRIEIDKKGSDKYNSGSIEIKFSEKQNEPTTLFNKVEHSFEAQTGLYDIVFYHNFDTKTLDISGEFKKGNISISIYFHSTNNQVPLIVGLIYGTDKKYFTYAEFFYNLSNSVKLSELKNINDHDLISTLTDQNKKFQNDLTIKITETGDYGKSGSEIPVKVLKGDQFDDFIFYTHISSDPFKHIKLETDKSFEITALKGSEFTYQKLMYIMVYYHVLDARNLCPLLIRLYTREVKEKEKSEQSAGKKQYQIIYNSIYYELSEINGDLDKKIYKICNLSESISSKLYSLFKGKLKSHIIKIFDIPSYSNYGLISLFPTDNFESQVALNYIYGNNKLYVYFHHPYPYSLLLCYGNSAYKRSLIDEQNNAWIHVPGVTSCLCNQNQVNTQIISALDELVDSIALIKKGRPLEKKEPSTHIDLSAKNNVYGYLNSITASDEILFDDCKLFIYYKHSLPNHTFSISSLKFTNPQTKIIPFDRPVTGVQSVIVYFNKNANDKPVLLEIILADGKKRYVKDLDNQKTNYSDSDLVNIEKENFVDQLIKESDRINQRHTFLIDKTIQYNGIKVTPQLRPEHGFSMYKHTPINLKPIVSNVLNNNQFLFDNSLNKDVLIEEIQNQNYNEIIVYFLDFDSKFPILAQFTKDRVTNSYVLKRSQNKFYWLKDQFSFRLSDRTRDKLDEVYYYLKSSLIIEISNIGQLGSTNNYEIRLIANTSSDGRSPGTSQYTQSSITADLNKIEVSDVSGSLRYLNSTSFKCYEHKLPDLKGTSVARGIYGLRLYMRSPGSLNPHEIELYDSSLRTKSRVVLFYSFNENSLKGRENSGKIKVFFHENNDKPLLLCHNDKGYKRIRNDNDIEWYDTKMKISNSQIFSTLRDIYSQMKKKFRFLKEGGINENVKLQTTQIGGSFEKDSYSAKDQASRTDIDFQISKDRLSNGIITSSIVDKLFENLYNTRFDLINIYKNKSASSLSDILLFEFTNESQKTYFQKVDKDGKFWVHKESVSGSIDNGKLSSIKSESNNNLIYEINKTSPSLNSGIKIQSSLKDPEDGFNKYTYTPSDGSPKTSIFFYNDEELIEKTSSKYQSIGELQNKKYLTVTVYFGEKIKGSGVDNQKNVPLLIEFTNNDKPSEPDYYVHRLHPTDNKYYWQKLRGTGLKDILIDIGFAITKGHQGYEQLKTILIGAGVDKVTEANDLSTKLTEIKPEQLKNLLNQKVGQPPGPSQKSFLSLLLRKIEFELLPSIVILLDKKHTNSQYGETDITQVIPKIEPARDINIINMSGNEQKTISLLNQTTNKAQCVHKYDYKLIVHDLNNVTVGMGEQVPSSIPIRFIVPTKTHGIYNQLTFYNADKMESQNIEYIYYASNQNEVYVYFYGDDPRPLLIGYNGSGYRATSKENYDENKWNKINKSIIYPCNNSGSNDELLNELTNLSKFLNEVQLQRIITSTKEIEPNKDGKTSEKTTYYTGNFNGEKISIDVTYRNLNCYRFFKHKANGTGSNGSGYRLGNVKYNNTILNYSAHYPLLCVYIYYSIYDVSHQYPLLIHLEFKNHNEYYELNNKEKPYNWTKINDTVNSGGIEQTAYNIRNKLSISYSEDQKQTKLFDDKECKEDDPDLGSLIGGPVGSLTGAGALGGAGYLVYAKVLVTATSVAPS